MATPTAVSVVCTLGERLDMVRSQLQLLHHTVMNVWRRSPKKAMAHRVPLATMRMLYGQYLHMMNEYTLFQRAALQAFELEGCSFSTWFPASIHFSPGRWKLVMRSSRGTYLEVEIEPLRSPCVLVPGVVDYSPLPPLSEYVEYEGECSSSCCDLFDCLSESSYSSSEDK